MQKTAFEMLRSLVGSEMCIRDRSGGVPVAIGACDQAGSVVPGLAHDNILRVVWAGAVLIHVRYDADQPAHAVIEAVSYTHLTLPTIYSV